MRRALLLVAVLLALALGGGAAVLFVDDGADEVAVRQPLPDPGPVPSRTPLLEPVGDDAPLPSRADIDALVTAALADPVLAAGLAVSVVDVRTGEVIYEREAERLLLPASTAKLVTAVAALTSLEPGHRLRTRVVAGSQPGEVVLVGGGDPTLVSSEQAQRTPDDARLDLLAAETLAALDGEPVTRVVVDDSLYSGPTTGPGWRPNYVTEGHVAPVTALMVDHGRVRPDRRARADDPALAAGQKFAELLARGGPAAAVERGRAAVDARELAAVESPPVASLVEQTLAYSDNDLAEALARQVALEYGEPASFAGAAVALREAAGELLADAGVPATSVRLVDGSGLSRDNAIAPGALTRLLTVVSSDPGRLAPLLTGLPVAGFSGTLDDRFRDPDEVPGAGVVRAKTGTLSGVSALAGVLRTDEGRLLAFALTAYGVPWPQVLAAEDALDSLAASFAACCA